MNLLSTNRLILTAALGLTACATSTAATRQQEADDRLADERAEAGLVEHHRHQHNGGAMQFVVMALDTLEPGDASRTQVEQVRRDLNRCLAPSAEIQQRLDLTIADGVAAGAVDLAKVDGIINQLDGTTLDARACGDGALNQLHAILSPAERIELVEKVEAHWDVWHQVNDDQQAAGRPGGGRLGRLTKELNLTPDQVEKAKGALHVALTGRAVTFDRARIEAELKAFDAAFVAASFDAKAATSRENGHLASFGATRKAIFYETVTPLLTASQRTELAGHLRQRAASHPIVSVN